MFRETVHAISADADWTNARQLDLALDFIESQGANSDFEAFLIDWYVHDKGENASVCVHCERGLWDDGHVLIDTTGGDVCGHPIGQRDHAHCRGFSPDAGGDDPDVCNECLCHKVDHRDVT